MEHDKDDSVVPGGAADRRASPAAVGPNESQPLSAETLRLALEAAHVGVWEWDVAADQVQWSELVEPIFGLPAGSFGLTYEAYMALLPPEDREPVREKIERTLRGGSGEYVLEHRIVWPDGSAHWIEGKGRVYRDAAGQPQRMVGTVMDVTARKLADEALRRAEAQLRYANRALRTIGRCRETLARATTEAELLHDLCRVIVGDGYSLAWVGFAEDDARRTIRVGAHAGDGDGYLARANFTWADEERGRGPTGMAIRSGRPEVCRDFVTDPRVEPWRADALGHGFRSSVVVPLRHGTAVFGAVSVYAAEPDAFGTEEVRLLADLANDLAFGLQAMRTRAAHLHAELSLAASEALLRQFIRHCPAAVAMLDNDMRYLQTSDRWLTDYHLDGQDIVGRAHYEVFPDVPPRWREIHQRVLAGAVERCDEDPFPRADGHTEWLQWEVRPWRQPSGAIGGIIMFTQVITERKRVAEALRASEGRLRSAMLHSPIGMAIVGLDGRWIEANPALCEIVGFTCEELLRLDFQRITHPDDLDTSVDHLRRLLTREIESCTLEKRYLHKDGHVVWVQLNVSLVRNDEGTPSHFITQIQDVTERRQTQAALQQQRRRSEAIIESASDGILTIDETHRIVVMNPAAERMFGCRAAELIGQSIDRFIPERHRATHPGRIDEFARSGVSTRQMGAFGAITGVRADGEEFPIEASISQVDVDHQKLFAVTLRDVSERKKADRALRDSEERLRQLAENLHEVVWMTDVRAQKTLYVSPSFERVWGLPTERLFSSPMAWLGAVHADDRERVRAALAQQLQGKYDVEYRVVRPDGAVRLVHERAFTIRDTTGEVYRVASVAEDITERRRIEEQFLQAQKMEAVGQLAGGVAHDFNNILGVIIIHAELAAGTEGVAAAVRESLNEIRVASERAANLTRQLLQFSRKQVMQVRRLDLNEVVTGIAKMLQRVLREDVNMHLELHPEPLLTDADAGMLDQILMNLAVNARDAMPDGGRLTIATKLEVLGEDDVRATPDAVAGRYVSLRVSDTGSGIAPENQARIFEPFFTTKAPGKGTGLGLATVFGIVKQHRGMISAASTPGAGTTFRILLPASATASLTTLDDGPGPRLRGGKETILLVEDDHTLRRATRQLLERYGYQVLEASSGIEALRIWEGLGHDIQLLITDLVMPAGLSGRELAARLRALQPSLKVVLTSGYSEEIAGRDLQLQPGQAFLAKPFEMRRLLESVRDTLDG